MNINGSLLMMFYFCNLIRSLLFVCPICDYICTDGFAKHCRKYSQISECVCELCSSTKRTIHVIDTGTAYYMAETAN